MSPATDDDDSQRSYRGSVVHRKESFIVRLSALSPSVPVALITERRSFDRPAWMPCDMILPIHRDPLGSLPNESRHVQ